MALYGVSYRRDLHQCPCVDYVSSDTLLQSNVRIFLSLLLKPSVSCQRYGLCVTGYLLPIIIIGPTYEVVESHVYHKVNKKITERLRVPGMVVF